MLCIGKYLIFKIFANINMKYPFKKYAQSKQSSEYTNKSISLFEYNLYRYEHVLWTEST